jgi:hypothetical protein
MFNLKDAARKLCFVMSGKKTGRNEPNTISDLPQV